jgi:hypothetical protein
MQDLFQKMTLQEFMHEERASVTATNDVGLVTAVLRAGTLVVQFTHDLVQSGVMSGYGAGGTADPNKGKETMLRGFAFMVVASALGMRELAGKLKIAEEFQEIDLLVSWYRTRWPR